MAFIMSVNDATLELWRDLSKVGSGEKKGEVGENEIYGFDNDEFI